VKEGAWIHSRAQEFAWIDDHARWIHHRAHAASLCLPESTIQRLEAIPPDHNGPGRRALLRLAMDAGLIRFWGHDAKATLESTMPWLGILRGSAPFLDAHAGPHLAISIHDLRHGEGLGAPWWVFQHTLENGRPEELQALVEPCVVR
jgi:hypothetical protein